MLLNATLVASEVKSTSILADVAPVLSCATTKYCISLFKATADLNKL